MEWIDTSALRACGPWHDRAEMARRFHARESLLRGSPVDATTLRALGEFPEPLYVVYRGAPDPGREPTGNYAAFLEPVYTGRQLSVFHVRRKACLAAELGGQYNEIDETLLLKNAGL